MRIMPPPSFARAIRVGQVANLPWDGTAGQRPAPRWLPPARRVHPLQLGVQVRGVVEPQDAAEHLGFARSTVGELGVSVEAGALVVAPGAMTGRPAGDDPALAVLRPAGGVRRAEDLVVVGL